MLARKLVAMGAMLGLVTLSGVAFSGQTTTVDVTLLQFNEATQIMLAVDENNNVGAFQHGPFTVHVPGSISHGLPPNPCDPLTHIYNSLVAHPIRNPSIEHFALLIVLSRMSFYKCGAIIVTDPGTGDMTSFQPKT